MMDVASVTIVFSVEPGGPPPTMADVIDWVDYMMTHHTEPDGPNGLRYSRGRIVKASLITDDS